MAIEDNTNEVTAADISKASAMLSGKGEDTTEAEKATPPQFEGKEKEADGKEDDDKDKEVEKGIPASEVASIVDQAVSKAVELVKAELFSHQAEISKSIATISDRVEQVSTDTKAVMQFQGASVEVLKDFQAVTKGIEAKVDEIGNQPAPRKAALTTTVEKGGQHPEHHKRRPPVGLDARARL